MTNCAWLVQVNIFFSSQNCFQTRLFPWQWLFFSCERVIKFQFKFYSLWWSVYVCLNGFKKGSLTSICNSINKFTLTVQSFVHLLFIQVNIVQKKIWLWMFDCVIFQEHCIPTHDFSIKYYCKLLFLFGQSWWKRETKRKKIYEKRVDDFYKQR